MIIISTETTLSHVIERETDTRLIEQLLRYQPMIAQYELAIIFIIQPGDRLSDLISYRQRDFTGWEFILHYEDGWYEAVFIISDDGFGHLVLIPDISGVDKDLLLLCRSNRTGNG